MSTKEKIRQVFQFLQSKEVGHNEYGNNGYVILSGKKYFIGKMSYDEWYIEPFYKNRKETDKFSDEVLWEKFDTVKILDLFVNNELLELKLK